MAKLLLTKREYFEQYRSQVPAIGRDTQQRLRALRVHVSGLGGIGSHVAMYLAELGVGKITANDPQVLTPDNLNRFPMGTIHDVGTSKVTLVQRYLQQRPHVRFAGLQERSESAGLAPYFLECDAIVCCSNTASSRQASVETAIRSRKLLLDVSVADGREHLGGAVKVYKPPRGGQLACPACYLNGNAIRRGEGLLATVVAATAALASHVLLGEVVGPRVAANLVLLNFNPLNVELLNVLRDPNCRVCGQRNKRPLA